MKFAIHTLLFLVLAILGVAVEVQKPVIISYPKDTPSSVLEEAKNAIMKAGGFITHEYNIIKAFAADAPKKALDMVQTMGATNNVVIEDDQTVTIQES